jgi:hypothetical protein
MINKENIEAVTYAEHTFVLPYRILRLVYGRIWDNVILHLLLRGAGLVASFTVNGIYVLPDVLYGVT